MMRFTAGALALKRGADEEAAMVVVRFFFCTGLPNAGRLAPSLVKRGRGKRYACARE